MGVRSSGALEFWRTCGSTELGESFFLLRQNNKTMVCPLCNRRKPERRCPRWEEICARCCGRNRALEECPEGCPHLKPLALKEGELPLYRVMRTTGKGTYSVIVSRERPDGNLQYIAALVDVWKMGLKDCFGSNDISKLDFHNTIRRHELNMFYTDCGLVEAQWLVKRGLRITGELGFSLPEEYGRLKHILGDMNDVDVGGSLYKCFSCGEGELPEEKVETIKAIAALDAAAGVCGTPDETPIYLMCEECEEEAMPGGRCVFCGARFGKKGMTEHLRTCSQRDVPASGRQGIKGFHIVARGLVYWIHISVSADITLEDLDGFLRKIWLECCGHMSEFTIEGVRYSIAPGDFNERDMKVSLDEVLAPGMEFYYVYDFGTPTDLHLRVVAEDETSSSSIRLLARNDPPLIACESCGETATLVCGICGESEEGWLCEECAPEHECGEDVLLPVVNSPRTGVCGYTGSNKMALTGGYEMGEGEFRKEVIDPISFYSRESEKTKFNWFLYEFSLNIHSQLRRSLRGELEENGIDWKIIAEFSVYISKRMKEPILEVFSGRKQNLVFTYEMVSSYFPELSDSLVNEMLDIFGKAWEEMLVICDRCPTQCISEKDAYCTMFDEGAY